MLHLARSPYSSVLLSATAFLIVGSTWALADDRVIPGSASPDKKWQIRRTTITEEAAEKGVDSDRALVRAGSTRPIVKLPLHVGDSDAADEEATIVWAPDSKRFAYNYRAGGRYETTQVYQLRNGRWKELRSLESKATSAPLDRVQTAQLAELKLPKDANRRRIWDTWEVTKWEDARTAILYANSIETVLVKKAGEEELEELSAHFLFTMSFDEQGNWRVIKTHEMSAKEIQEREQPNDGSPNPEDT
ncbi:MAG TPA: hypothetical protein VF551_06380 [Chthoniobacterales bacterium]